MPVDYGGSADSIEVLVGKINVATFWRQAILKFPYFRKVQESNLR